MLMYSLWIALLYGDLSVFMGSRISLSVNKLSVYWKIWDHILIRSGSSWEILMKFIVNIGYPYTWNNKRAIPHNTQVCLDKAVATPTWKILFPNTQISNLIVRRSDHLAIRAEFDKQLLGSPPRRPRAFRFESVWLKAEYCHRLAAESWDT